MRFFALAVMMILGGLGCNNNGNAPDVSQIKVELSTQRFEEDFFGMDSTRLQTQLSGLMQKYPSFGGNFISTILNTDPKWPEDSALNYVKNFIVAYRKVYDSSERVFADFTPYENQVKKTLQYLHYYFPDYAAPNKIITYIGPLDGYGDILDVDAFVVGVHHHLGKGFSMYQSELVMSTYPEYITSRFEPDYIAINCMRNVISDMFPEKMEDKTLVIQMVEKGKRLYLLQKLVPFAPENRLIGYSEIQYKACKEKEAVIWDLFLQNNLLQSIDNGTIKNYLGEGPKTPELGESAPGNIGSFCGWQIINKYMKKFPNTKLDELMRTDAEMIFQKAKYKP